MREIERERVQKKGGQGSVTCSPKRLPKGGQRWNNTSEIGGVING